MIALDTNVLARYLLNDDAEQAEAAEALLSSGERFFVPLTVWLELVWVLECYDCSREEIAKALRHLLGLPDLQASDTLALLRALNGFEGGSDFADALHLALSSHAQSFATFDQALIKRGRARCAGTPSGSWQEAPAEGIHQIVTGQRRQPTPVGGMVKITVGPALTEAKEQFDDQQTQQGAQRQPLSQDADDQHAQKRQQFISAPQQNLRGIIDHAGQADRFHDGVLVVVQPRQYALPVSTP